MSDDSILTKIRHCAGGALLMVSLVGSIGPYIGLERSDTRDFTAAAVGFVLFLPLAFRKLGGKAA